MSYKNITYQFLFNEHVIVYPFYNKIILLRHLFISNQLIQSIIGVRVIGKSLTNRTISNRPYYTFGFPFIPVMFSSSFKWMRRTDHRRPDARCLRDADTILRYPKSSAGDERTWSVKSRTYEPRHKYVRIRLQSYSSFPFITLTWLRTIFLDLRWKNLLVMDHTISVQSSTIEIFLKFVFFPSLETHLLINN